MSTNGNRAGRPGSGMVLTAFLYVWLMVGFFTGTVVLIGPVRWVTGGIQSLGWEQTQENYVVRGVILLYVIASFLISLWLVRTMFRRGTGRPLRFGIPLVVTLAAVVSLWGWMNPSRMLASVAGGTEESLEIASGAEFIFGPYPDHARLEELKGEGVVAVVSLQHPAVPIEVPGIAAERRSAAELGIDFIHAPMLPWVSDNAESLALIRKLVEEGRGKYYIHCGLGRDRASVVRRLVERVGAETGATRDFKTALTFADRERQAADGEVPSPGFERGLLTELEQDVWLIPHPNQRELYGYMLAGQVASVVSLLDPADPEQASWLQEQRIFREYEIGLESHPLTANDAARAEEIARHVRTLPRPVAIIAPRTSWSGPDRPSDGSEVASTFYRAYLAAAEKARVATR